MKKLLLLIILHSSFFTLPSFCFAQNKNIDSLVLLLEKDIADTNKVNHLNQAGREFYNIGDLENGLKYANKALALARAVPIGNKRGWSKGIAKAYNNKGNIYLGQGNYPLALKMYLASLKLFEDANDKHGAAISYNNIGIVYMSQGNDPEALKNYFASLKIREFIGDKQAIAASYNNIGLLYTHYGNFPEALKNYMISLKLYEELGDKHAIARSEFNIGIIFEQQDNFQGALQNYRSSLKIFEDFGDKTSISAAYGNIGNLYKKKNDFPQAMKSYKAALKIQEEIGDKKGIATLLLNLGSVQIMLHRLHTAQDYFKNALLISTEIGDMEIIKGSHSGLAEVNRNRNQWKEAYKHQELSILYRDSINNIETNKKIIESSITYKYEKQELENKTGQDKKDALTEASNKKQKIITGSVTLGLLLVLFFAGFVFRSLRITRKQKQIIEIKSIETELQKKIIEEKNKDITDSIRYAKRIQDALMGEQGHVSMHLPEHFILFIPKDIVSGDFHWGAEKQGHWYFAAVDCTGHGVPGAVMSMLGISFLNDIVASEKLLNPADILNQLRDKVVTELRQTGEAGGSKDGMDISLCRINLKTNELQWAGANNALNLIRNGQSEEIKADKQPIGYHPENHTFTNHEIQLQKGDSIYIYSDGYADQFGGPKGKKFKYKQLEDLIIANNHLPMTEQKELLKNRFTKWKGSLEQVDDICVFGVRV